MVLRAARRPKRRADREHSVISRSLPFVGRRWFAASARGVPEVRDVLFSLAAWFVFVFVLRTCS